MHRSLEYRSLATARFEARLSMFWSEWLSGHGSERFSEKPDFTSAIIAVCGRGSRLCCFGKEMSGVCFVLPFPCIYMRPKCI